MTPMRRRPDAAVAVRTASVAGVRTAVRAGPIAPITAMPTTETIVSRTVDGVWATSIRPMRCAAMRVSTAAKGWSTKDPTRMPGRQDTTATATTVAMTPTNTCRGRAPARRHLAQSVRRACTQDCPTTATTGIATIAE